MWRRLSIALLAPLVLFVSACSAGSAHRSAVPPSVPVIPAGWQAVGYGDAVIFVPAGWARMTVDCPYGSARNSHRTKRRAVHHLSCRNGVGNRQCRPNRAAVTAGPRTHHRVHLDQRHARHLGPSTDLLRVGISGPFIRPRKSTQAVRSGARSSTPSLGRVGTTEPPAKLKSGGALGREADWSLGILYSGFRCAPGVSLCVRQVAPDSGGPANGRPARDHHRRATPRVPITQLTYGK